LIFNTALTKEQTMKSTKIFLLSIAGMLFLSQQINATELTVPNTFSSGTPAVAADVNANFDAVKSAVDDNDSRLVAVEAMLVSMQASLNTANETIASLQAELNTVQANEVLNLGGIVTVGPDANGYQTVLFTGVNLQVVNGVNQTTPNGVGNLIVGYNAASSGMGSQVCSDPQYLESIDCENAGETWSSDHKTGSHNIVGGSQNSYSQTGGLLVGNNNIINQHDVTVSGGQGNIASGLYASISGGVLNIATASHSSVSGGQSNAASGFYSNVSGGGFNIASGQNSSVSGGWRNNALSLYSSASGGRQNTASGIASSVSAGRMNFARASYSAVSGGESNITNGVYSNISGGNNRTLDGIYDWRAGTLFEDF